MSSYYTELDADRGADLEAIEDMERRDRQRDTRERHERNKIRRIVHSELKAAGIRGEPGTLRRGCTVEVTCKCGKKFQARVADRKRGWGRFCSKRCKAIYQ